MNAIFDIIPQELSESRNGIKTATLKGRQIFNLAEESVTFHDIRLAQGQTTTVKLNPGAFPMGWSEAL